MYGAELGDSHVAVGADRQGERGLRGTVDVEDELVARAEDIVLRRGDVHLGLKGEILVVEDVTAEDALASRGCLFFDKHGGVGTLMGDNLVVGHLIVGAHTVLGIADGIIDGIVKAALGNLAGILATDALNLLHRGPALQQPGGNLGL